MTFWRSDPTSTAPPTYTTTAESDETISLDATALLVDADPPTAPEATLFRIVDNGADVPVEDFDAPTLGAENMVLQRLRGLEAGVTYRYRLSFLTSGNRRALTLIVLCVE